MNQVVVGSSPVAVKQIDDIWEQQKKKGGVSVFGSKRSCLKRIRSYYTGKEGVGSRHSFANDKNVIAENVF